MKKIKIFCRLVVLVILILLAASGIGITGTFLPTDRQRFQDNEILVGQVDEKEEDESPEE